MRSTCPQGTYGREGRPASPARRCRAASRLLVAGTSHPARPKPIGGMPKYTVSYCPARTT